MTTNDSQSTMDEMRERALDRARTIVAVFQDAAEHSANGTAESLGAAFQAAADTLRDQADAATEARKKGWQSFTKDLRNAAGRIVGISQDLAELAKLDVHAVQLHAVDGDGSDPSAIERLAALPDGEIGSSIDVLTDAQIVREWRQPRTLTLSGAVDQAIERENAAFIEREKDAVRAYLAGETDVLPDDATPEPEDVNEIMQPTAPHLAFLDPAPISLPPREPFPGANDYRRSFADLMRPVPADLAPDHWSWSQLTGAEDCGLQYRFGRLEGVPQQPQWANIGGSAFHAVTERFDRGARQAGGADRLPEPHAELLKQRWEEAFATEIGRVSLLTGIEMGETGENFRASRGGKEGYTWWLVEGERMLSMYVALRRKLDKAGREAGALAEPLTLGAPDGAPVIEYEYTRSVPGPTGTLTVKGVIDRAYRCSDGSIIVKDLKSGAGTPDTGQLGEYAWALADLLRVPGTDLPVVRGCFYDARKGIFTDPVGLLGQPNHPHEEYVYRYHAAQAQRSAGIYLPHKSVWCNGCSVRHACPVGGPTIS